MIEKKKFLRVSVGPRPNTVFFDLLYSLLLSHTKEYGPTKGHALCSLSLSLSHTHTHTLSLSLSLSPFLRENRNNLFYSKTSLPNVTFLLFKFKLICKPHLTLKFRLSLSQNQKTPPSSIQTQFPRYIWRFQLKRQEKSVGGSVTGFYANL